MKIKFIKCRSFLIMTLFVLSSALVGVGLPTNAIANIDDCAEDECEASWLGDKCVDNPGERTYCEFIGSDCKTKACSC